MPSNSFYVVLPSNTNVDGNRTNTFRVRLPRKLQFNSEWEVGLAVIVYPYSWPSLGTIDQQYVHVEWQTGESVRIPVPTTNITNPDELSTNLHRFLGEGSEELAKKTRTAQISFNEALEDALKEARNDFLALKRKLGQPDLPFRNQGESDEVWQNKLNAFFAKLDEAGRRLYSGYYETRRREMLEKMHEEDRAIYASTKDLGGMEAWIHAYKKARFACRFEFHSSKNRFTLILDKKFIKRVQLSDQLAYILGFNTIELSEAVNVAKFMPDMSGGVSSFNVYAPDLIEPMMIGDVTAPVLRMVTVRGRPDEVIEEQFLSIQYHRVLVKEVSEMFIEIRTSSGGLMPFQYGTCTLTLHFRKAAYF